MANKAIMFNAILGLGVLGLGALLVAERGVRSGKREADGAQREPPASAAVEAVPAARSRVEALPSATGAGSLAPAPAAGVSGAAAASSGPMEASPVAGAPAAGAAGAPTRPPGEPARPLAAPSPSVEPGGHAAESGSVPAGTSAGAPAGRVEVAVASPAQPRSDAGSEESECEVAESHPREPAESAPLKASQKASDWKVPPGRLTEHVVASGDTLLKLARQHHVTTAIIRRMNGISGDVIRLGAKLAIPEGPFRAVIDRSAFRLAIILDETTVKEYPVAVGKGGSTPAGEFEVRSRVEDPEWTSPEGAFFASGDPANPLGARWLGFDESGHGIHGTTDPSSIGTEASQGCVRLNKDDVLEVYDFLTLGSKVTIR